MSDRDIERETARHNATVASRLGLNIGEYDQVIALSQDNINETLQYHYDNHEELKKFEAKLAVTTKDAIRGTLAAPTIELIDVEGADQAFYCLVFTEGSYTWWDQKPADPNEPIDPDAPPASAQWIQTKIPIKGWKLAFYVDFAMKKMINVPDNIKNQISIPGSYGVDQLLINFGTADTMTFDWTRSVVTGFSDKKSEVAGRDMISLFVSRWLTKVKDAPGNHNVLGYAVKVDPGNTTIPDTEPSFPPTAVRLQTINFRPDGKRDNASPSDGRNAFLFTEVTGNEGPPPDPRVPEDPENKVSRPVRRLAAIPELAWSGDFFYDGFGGTLIMSRRIFWDKFLKARLRVVNKDAITALNGVAATLATPELATHTSWWLSDSNNVGDGEWTSTEGLNEKYTWKTSKYFDVDHEVDGPNHMYEYWIDTSVTHTLRPEVGTGNIHLDYDIEFKTILKIGQFGMLKSVACFTVTTTSIYSGSTTITLQAVDRIGGLSVTATDSVSKPNITVTADTDGIAARVLKAIPYVGDLFRDETALNAIKQQMKTAMESSIADVKSTTEEIQTALSGQKRFVFPGGGTFDMKSPIFSNKGDLLIALSYRKGEQEEGGPLR